MSPLLATLLHALPDFSASGPLPAIKIIQVTADSRQVQPGALFVAVQGGVVDGHRFIADAVRRGATAVVGTEALTPETTEVVTTSGVPYVQVANSRAALALAALRAEPRRSAGVGLTEPAHDLIEERLWRSFLFRRNVKQRLPLSQRANPIEAFNPYLFCQYTKRDIMHTAKPN